MSGFVPQDHSLSEPMNNVSRAIRSVFGIPSRPQQTAPTPAAGSSRAIPQGYESKPTTQGTVPAFSGLNPTNYMQMAQMMANNQSPQGFFTPEQRHNVMQRMQGLNVTGQATPYQAPQMPAQTHNEIPMQPVAQSNQGLQPWADYQPQAHQTQSLPFHASQWNGADKQKFMNQGGYLPEGMPNHGYFYDFLLSNGIKPTIF